MPGCVVPSRLHLMPGCVSSGHVGSSGLTEAVLGWTGWMGLAEHEEAADGGREKILRIFDLEKPEACTHHHGGHAWGHPVRAVARGRPALPRHLRRDDGRAVGPGSHMTGLGWALAGGRRVLRQHPHSHRAQANVRLLA